MYYVFMKYFTYTKNFLTFVFNIAKSKFKIKYSNKIGVLRIYICTYVIFNNLMVVYDKLLEDVGIHL